MTKQSYSICLPKATHPTLLKFALGFAVIGRTLQRRAVCARLFVPMLPGCKQETSPDPPRLPSRLSVDLPFCFGREPLAFGAAAMFMLPCLSGHILAYAPPPFAHPHTPHFCLSKKKAHRHSVCVSPSCIAMVQYVVQLGIPSGVWIISARLPPSDFSPWCHFRKVMMPATCCSLFVSSSYPRLPQGSLATPAC